MESGVGLEAGVNSFQKESLSNSTPLLEEINSHHTLWKIPIHIQSIEVQPDGREVCDNNPNNIQTVWVSIKTCTVPPSLVPIPKRLNFGEITVHERQVMHLELLSRQADDLDIHLTNPVPEISSCF